MMTCQRLRRRVVLNLRTGRMIEEGARIARCGLDLLGDPRGLCLPCRAGVATAENHPVCTACGYRLPADAAHDEVLAFCSPVCEQLHWGWRAFLGEVGRLGWREIEQAMEAVR